MTKAIIISKAENILCTVFANTFERTNSELVDGVTNKVEIVDSVFSKNITLPIYIILIIVASTIRIKGNTDEKISISRKYKITPHINAINKLMLNTLYLCNLNNSPFTSCHSLLRFISKSYSGNFNEYIF